MSTPSPRAAEPVRRRTLTRRVAVLGLPLVLLVSGLGTSAGVSAALRDYGVRQAEEASRQLAGDEAASLGDAVRDYTHAVGALAKTVGGQPVVTDDVFQDLTATMTSLPGLANLTYTVPVPDDPGAVARAQEELRAQLGTRLTLAPRPSPAGEHRFIVSYRGIDTVGTSLGADAAAVPQLAEAATAARGFGAVTVTAPYVLLADRSRPVQEQQQSVVFTAPVTGGPGQADEGTFRGWVSASFRTGNVLEATAARRTSVSAGLKLWDVTDPAAPLLMTEVEADSALSPESVTADVVAGSRRWRLEVTPTLAAHAADVGRAPLVALVGGSVLSLLLAALLFSVTSGRERAQRKVEQATVDLADEVASRRRSEEALRTRESELGAYTTVVADRLRLPLSQLSALTDAARETGPATGADWLGRLDAADRRLDRARRLVDDLLLYAQVSEMALTERAVDLFATGTLVADEQEALTAHLPEDLRPRIEVGPLPEVVGEPWLLHQLLARLVDNAVVHAPHGQPALVTLGAELTGSRFRGEVWRVEVRDRGLGVPSDRRASVFEPFAGEAADVELGGNHLSLALCRRIALRLGGDIGLDDDPRGGSVFWFTLPVRSTQGMTVAPSVAAPPVPALT
ncbi:sensor histidine kinase [Kineococcus aurantiacus]|uniref:Sensor-like histidine kinase SenX3 n=1 Tax=Kineococcus aurantiacus TaxID=37633 RepID=A0A7Y9DN36_9ACTN|nr:signal transduction histidine kinase [Kineococcus aurantiacus]